MAPSEDSKSTWPRSRGSFLVAGIIVGMLAVALYGLIGHLADPGAEPTEGEAPREPSVVTGGAEEPQCTVRVVLQRFRVAQDTEIGEEEWTVQTHFRPGGIGGTSFTTNTNAWIVLGTQMSQEVHPKSAFPMQAQFWVMATEEDPFTFDERGMYEAKGYVLNCPDKRSLAPTIRGDGYDLFQQTFLVNTELEWIVTGG